MLATSFFMRDFIGAAALPGAVAMWSLILVGLCHPILCPAIFAMGIRGLGPLTEEASGLPICALWGSKPTNALPPEELPLAPE